jgi:hypothetical protein
MGGKDYGPKGCCGPGVLLFIVGFAALLNGAARWLV